MELYAYTYPLASLPNGPTSIPVPEQIYNTYFPFSGGQNDAHLGNFTPQNNAVITLYSFPQWGSLYQETLGWEVGDLVYLRRVVYSSTNYPDTAPLQNIGVQPSEWDAEHGDQLECEIVGYFFTPGMHIFTFKGEDQTGINYAYNNMVYPTQASNPIQPYHSPYYFNAGPQALHTWQVQGRGGGGPEGPVLNNKIQPVLHFEMQHAIFPISPNSLGTIEPFASQEPNIFPNGEESYPWENERFITTGVDQQGIVFDQNTNNTITFSSRLTYRKFWWADGNDNFFIDGNNEQALADFSTNFAKYIHLTSPVATSQALIDAGQGTNNFTLVFDTRQGGTWKLNAAPKIGSNLVIRGIYEIF